MLRILLVEDRDDDAALIERALKALDYQSTIHRVQTPEQFDEALDGQSWDVVISDHSLPRFSSTAALQRLHARNLDLPFIVVSGTIDEESAVSILRAGAHDFVTKQSLARLGPAIRRELSDARTRAERRQARRDLQVQRDFLRLVLDTTPNLIFVKNQDGQFTLANRSVADVYGTTVDDLVGKRDRDFNRNGAEVDASLQADRDVMRTGRPLVTPAEAVTDARTGETRWFETRRVPLALPDGTRQVLGIGTEITERRIAEEALRTTEEQFRQAQKMEAVGQLAGGIAHDFNNLLTAILGYSSLLLDRVRDMPEVAGDLEEIHKAGERASGLTSQLLAFSRKQVLELRILNLNDVVGEAERILRRVIGEDVQLEVALDPALRPLKADQGQMHQVLMNLCVNARDAMPRGGTLRLTTANGVMPAKPGQRRSAPERCVTLTVADTGSGIPDDVRARIFEPFFTTKGPGKGTGLGLSMVYGVVTQCGGQVDVASQPGRGTRFTIYLPVAHEAADDVLPRPEGSNERGGTETILLVEDERPIRELVRKVLARHGYHVLEAADTDNAMELAEHHPAPIHLLLSDIVMPKLSGPELAQRIVPRRREMRVLYMSGFVNRLATAFGTLSPAVDVLHKPFTPDLLLRKVRDCLNAELAPSASLNRSGNPRIMR